MSKLPTLSAEELENVRAYLRTTIRAELLEGNLVLPLQFIELIGEKHQKVMESMFHALFYNYVKNKGATSVPYWYTRFNDDRAFNKFLKHLSLSGWVTSQVEPQRNWGEMWMNEEKLLTFVSREELIEIRKSFKLDKYKLTNKTKFGPTNITKTAQGKQNTGLERMGFAKAGQTQFQYATKYISKYQFIIEQNLTKSMDKLSLDYELFIDGADYSSISKDVLRYHIQNPNLKFTTGDNLNDSRGRAISSALGKIFNPIGNKDARSLLVIPEEDAIPTTKEALPAIFLFIAELLGEKPKTLTQKERAGFRAYSKRTFHDFQCVPQLTTSMTLEETKIEQLRAEKDRADFHENIWLERIYNELDHYYLCAGKNIDFKWSVPIEVDATASFLQIEGALLGHEPFLRRTNCIGDTLEDMWDFPGISRKQFKTATTPMLYGSSKSATDLWKKAKQPYTQEQVTNYKKEMLTGDLSVANAFKDFIINNVKPQEQMEVTIWGETFHITCNRYKNKGDYVVRYNAYDTKTGRVQSIYHTHTHKEPDLEQFRRYFVTLLCHNLDSQIANFVCSRQFWIIPIHDAFLINPMDAQSVKTDYAFKITEIFQQRETILSEYFQSIGIDSKSATAWKKVKSSIIPAPKDFICQTSALK